MNIHQLIVEQLFTLGKFNSIYNLLTSSFQNHQIFEIVLLVVTCMKILCEFGNA